MGVAALISWIVTALAGATLFGIWLSRGGLRRQGAGASRFPPAPIFGHPTLAATGLQSRSEVCLPVWALRWYPAGTPPSEAGARKSMKLPGWASTVRFTNPLALASNPGLGTTEWSSRCHCIGRW
jgi:hypothetical protein